MRSDPIIYIIDDDEAVRRSIEIVVATTGFTTKGFASAEDFLDRYDGYTCGCLIIDLRLKDRSGLELLEVLRANQCALPALMISGHADVPVAVRSM